MSNSFLINVGPFILINGLFVIGYIFFMALGFNKTIHPSLKKTANEKFISLSFQNYWFSITEPLVDYFIKRKITPNKITFIGLYLSIFSGFLFTVELWGFAGWMMIASGVFDLFDGRVARKTNNVTKSGGFLDSIIDRYSDGFILLGLTLSFKDSWLFIFCLLCFIGFFTISYNKARSEANGITCNVGIFQRPERIYSLGLAAIFTPIISYLFNTDYPLLIHLIVPILAIGTIASSIYRAYYSFKRI
jgi:phosphatidylglycerophosphate synthase